MPSSLPRALFASIAILSATPALAQTTPATVEAPRPQTITVNGVGEAGGKPDVATTVFTVLRTGETARAALNEANAAMETVIAAMKELGIAPRDLQTAGFSINPQYRYEEPRDGIQAPPQIVGYEVRNTLSVKVRDIGEIGAILDRAVTLGVNQGGDIVFEVDDATAVRNEARREAVENASATARVLTEAAGVTLGPVVEIIDLPNESGPIPMQRSMAMMAEAAPSSVPVETGENTIRASVRMVFEITE